MTFYVDNGGVYKGSLEGDHGVDVSAWTEVASAPPFICCTWSGTEWIYTKNRLKNMLADYRWEKECGGIVFNGLPVSTDDRSKMLLASIQQQIEDLGDPTHVRNVKTVAGFLELSDAALSALYAAVIAHVQKCFDCENLIIADIDSDSLITPSAVYAAFDAAYEA